MSGGSHAVLQDRGTVSVGGPDAASFLQNIVTADVAHIAEERAGYGALLTPQGKILFDFIIHPSGAGFLLDTPRASAAELTKRLLFYRLHAKVAIDDVSDSHTVFAAWGGNEPPAGKVKFRRDPRLAALGFRGVAPAGVIPDDPRWSQGDAAAYHRHRIALGVPEAGADFAYGQAFPHDADMDQLHGIGMEKGCYIGQEVVSRMEYRGTARRRIVRAMGAGALPPPGTPIAADGRALGELASVAGSAGLARVRVDRVKEAFDAGAAVTAGDVPVSLVIPEWARFEWSAGVGED